MKLQLYGTDYMHTPYGVIEKFFVSISRGFGASFFMKICK
ncbi:Hypothetical protein FBFL15_1244 [Flavobacterium branchiophilum FL-15]|uniref:Uncharacterized protein n=1 Tax=Flavobacterium branchiophilum (strain FL-15) TaxID=1034807 RepID=G2Z0D7_FLABF|nr:Hypothetical protein FBFL15_1244 [Flavobacterium branchiophilum FL-15]